MDVSALYICNKDDKHPCRGSKQCGTTCNYTTSEKFAKNPSACKILNDFFNTFDINYPGVLYVMEKADATADDSLLK